MTTSYVIIGFACNFNSASIGMACEASPRIRTEGSQASTTLAI